MFTGLASPSHLIVVLAILLLLFGAKRIPELARGLGDGIKEFREGISSSDDEAKVEVSESEMSHHKAPRESEASDDEDGALSTHAGQRRRSS
jgi:sec-independent protein translocase protein TatA